MDWGIDRSTAAKGSRWTGYRVNQSLNVDEPNVRRPYSTVLDPGSASSLFLIGAGQVYAIHRRGDSHRTLALLVLPLLQQTFQQPVNTPLPLVEGFGVAASTFDWQFWAMLVFPLTKKSITRFSPLSPHQLERVVVVVRLCKEATAFTTWMETKGPPGSEPMPPSRTGLADLVRMGEGSRTGGGCFHPGPDPSRVGRV